MRTALFGLILFALPALADTDTFYGWSKDGTYFVYQSVSGPNDLTELFFCITDESVPPTWPKELNELERMGTPFSCVRYTDVNRAPYGWKTAVALPKASLAGPSGGAEPAPTVPGQLAAHRVGFPGHTALHEVAVGGHRAKRGRASPRERRAGLRGLLKISHSTPRRCVAAPPTPS